MADGILHSLNVWRESKEFSLWLPYLRIAAMVVMGFSVGLVCAAIEVSAWLSDVRAALRDIDMPEKAACLALGVNRGNLSDKLRGERPFTLEALAKLGPDFGAAFAVRLAMRFGSPARVTVALRLARDARRQARMSLPPLPTKQESAS